MNRPVVFAVTNKAGLSSYSSCMELKVDRGVTVFFNGGKAVSLQDIQLKFLRMTLDRGEVSFIICCAVE